MGSRAGNRAWLREWPSLRVMELETTESGWACSKHHRGTTTEHYAGIDVSLESASLCVVDATGRIVREAKVASEPATKPLVSYQIKPTTVWVAPSSTGVPRRRGALNKTG